MVISSFCTPQFIDCCFRGNVADDGGAAWGGGFVDALFSDCLFEGNRATGEHARGGALLFVHASLPIFERCTFRDNTAELYGGAFYCYLSCEPEFRGCTFTGCAAPQASSIYCDLGSVPRLDNCLIAFGTGGDPVYSPDSIAPLLRCCDIYGNEGGDWVALIADQYGQDGNICADPLLCDLAAGDLTLHSDSPCLPGVNPDCGLIGAWPVGCPTSDVESWPRDRGHAARDGIVLQLAPNPLTSSAQIRLVIPAGLVGQTLELSVVTPGGRVVRRLLTGPAAARLLQSEWDCRDDGGRRVAAGLYFCCLRIADRTVLRRTVLLR